MKNNESAVALGRKSAATLKKRLGAKAYSERMSILGRSGARKKKLRARKPDKAIELLMDVRGAYLTE